MDLNHHNTKSLLIVDHATDQQRTGEPPGYPGSPPNVVASSLVCPENALEGQLNLRVPLLQPRSREDDELD